MSDYSDINNIPIGIHIDNTINESIYETNFSFCLCSKNPNFYKKSMDLKPDWMILYKGL